MTEVEAVVFVIDDDGRFANHLTTQMSMRERSSRSGRGWLFCTTHSARKPGQREDAALKHS
jgi:hypothetical protein